MKDNSVIQVNNKEYTVVSIIKVEKDKFAYLINVDNYNDIMFAKIKKNEIEVIEDKSVLKNLIKRNFLSYSYVIEQIIPLNNPPILYILYIDRYIQ